MRRRLRGRGGQPRRVGGGYVYKSPPPSPRVTPPKPKAKPVAPPPQGVRVFARGDNGDESDARALATARLQAKGMRRLRPAQPQTLSQCKSQATMQETVWVDSDGNLRAGDDDTMVTWHHHRPRRPHPHSCVVRKYQILDHWSDHKFTDARTESSSTRENYTNSHDKVQHTCTPKPRILLDLERDGLDGEWEAATVSWRNPAPNQPQHQCQS